MKESMSVFNKYLIFERDLYNFTVSYNLEFIKKTKEHKHYIREFKPIVKKRKAQGYIKFYIKFWESNFLHIILNLIFTFLLCQAVYLLLCNFLFTDYNI